MAPSLTAPTANFARRHDQASQFSRLPPALLTTILQGLPQQERLRSCSTVHTSWATAATAATVDVDLEGTPADAIAAFQPWLQQHAGQLVSIRVKLLDCLEATSFCDQAFKPAIFKLPISNLQQLSRLDLAGVELQLGSATDADGSSSSSSSSSTAMLPKLKALKLQDCLNIQTLPWLVQLPGLTRFKVLVNSTMAQLKQDDLQRLLQGLPALAHLSLGCTAEPSSIIPVLPADSLTALTLDPSRTSTPPELPCSISHLVNLRKLKLKAVKVDPVVLSGMTLLTHLQLDECEMVAGSAAAFLAAVGAMRQLQHLSLIDNINPMNLGTAQPCDCAALTAASQLTHLEVFCYVAQPLPATAVQHMFPAGKQFPQLQQLSISSCDFDGSNSVGRVTTAELRSIISACPALCCLEIVCALTQDADVSVLLQLPATCSTLKVGGEPFGDSAVGVVVQLTQLTRLQWDFAPGLTDAGLQLLTALSGLQALRMTENHGLSEAVVEKEEGYMSETLEVYSFPGKSVSQQLHDFLSITPTSAAWLPRVEQQQQEIAGQQDRLRALSCFTAQLVDVLTFCSSDAEVLATVRSTADIGRRLLDGSDVEGVDSRAALQQYLQLQGRVLQFCASTDAVAAALASMEAAVKRAVVGG